MAECIDREEYCEKHCRCSNEYCDKESCPIWKAPAAGVAPVVRCEDCKHGEVYDRTDGKKGIYCHCPRSIFYYGNGSIFAPVRENLDFCSYGEPKEGDHA